MAIIWIAFMLGVVGLIAWRVTHREGGADGADPLSSVMGDSKPEPGDLDPAPYRGLITSLEAELYRPAGHSPNLEEVHGALTELAVSLSQAPSFRAKGASRTLLQLSQSMPEMGTLTRSWEEIRDRVFVPAPWFKKQPSAP